MAAILAAAAALLLALTACLGPVLPSRLSVLLSRPRLLRGVPTDVQRPSLLPPSRHQPPPQTAALAAGTTATPPQGIEGSVSWYTTPLLIGAIGTLVALLALLRPRRTPSRALAAAAGKKDPLDKAEDGKQWLVEEDLPEVAAQMQAEEEEAAWKENAMADEADAFEAELKADPDKYDVDDVEEVLGLRYADTMARGFSTTVYRDEQGHLVAGWGHRLTEEEQRRFKEGDVVDDGTLDKWEEEADLDEDPMDLEQEGVVNELEELVARSPESPWGDDPRVDPLPPDVQQPDLFAEDKRAWGGGTPSAARERKPDPTAPEKPRFVEISNDDEGGSGPDAYRFDPEFEWGGIKAGVASSSPPDFDGARLGKGLGGKGGNGTLPKKPPPRRIGFARGTVTRWMADRGFGFCTTDEGVENVFIHQTAIIAEGWRVLSDGERIEFELVDQDNRLTAMGVKSLGGGTPTLERKGKGRVWGQAQNWGKGGWAKNGWDSFDNAEESYEWAGKGAASRPATWGGRGPPNPRGIDDIGGGGGDFPPLGKGGAGGWDPSATSSAPSGAKGGKGKAGGDLNTFIESVDSLSPGGKAFGGKGSVTAGGKAGDGMRDFGPVGGSGGSEGKGKGKGEGEGEGEGDFGWLQENLNEYDDEEYDGDGGYDAFLFKQAGKGPSLARASRPEEWAAGSAGDAGDRGGPKGGEFGGKGVSRGFEEVGATGSKGGRMDTRPTFDDFGTEGSSGGRGGFGEYEGKGRSAGKGGFGDGGGKGGFAGKGAFDDFGGKGGTGGKGAFDGFGGKGGSGGKGAFDDFGGKSGSGGKGAFDVLSGKGGKGAFDDFGGKGGGSMKGRFEDFGGKGESGGKGAFDDSGGKAGSAGKGAFDDFGAKGGSGGKGAFDDFGGKGGFRGKGAFDDFGGKGGAVGKGAFDDYGGKGGSAGKGAFDDFGAKGGSGGKGSFDDFGRQGKSGGKTAFDDFGAKGSMAKGGFEAFGAKGGSGGKGAFDDFGGRAGGSLKGGFDDFGGKGGASVKSGFDTAEGKGAFEEFGGDGGAGSKGVSNGLAGKGSKGGVSYSGAKGGPMGGGGGSDELSGGEFVGDFRGKGKGGFGDFSGQSSVKGGKGGYEDMFGKGGGVPVGKGGLDAFEGKGATNGFGGKGTFDESGGQGGAKGGKSSYDGNGGKGGFAGPKGTFDGFGSSSSTRGGLAGTLMGGEGDEEDFRTFDGRDPLSGLGAKGPKGWPKGGKGTGDSSFSQGRFDSSEEWGAPPDPYGGKSGFKGDFGGKGAKGGPEDPSGYYAFGLTGPAATRGQDFADLDAIDGDSGAKGKGGPWGSRPPWSTAGRSGSPYAPYGKGKSGRGFEGRSPPSDFDDLDPDFGGDDN